MNASEIVALQWLRPGWLWLLPVIVAIWLVWWRVASRAANPWHAVVDPALRPYVIEAGSSGARNLAGPLALLLGWLLATVLLAGPVWERRAVPVLDVRAAQVVLLDLSPSMLGEDLAPDRLTRARYKIRDLLDRAPDDLHALIGFAERPYVIAPLTDDAATVRTFLDALSPDVMPVPGSRLDLAIRQGVELLENAEIEGGRLLAVTDAQPDERARDAARDAASAGHRLSILAVGTGAGVPLRGSDGQFVKRADGSIVVSRLDLAGLDALARIGGGRAAALSIDAGDLQRLDRPAPVLADGAARAQPANERSWWIERAPFGVPVLAAAALWLFRREAYS